MSETLAGTANEVDLADHPLLLHAVIIVSLFSIYVRVVGLLSFKVGTDPLNYTRNGQIPKILEPYLTRQSNHKAAITIYSG